MPGDNSCLFHSVRHGLMKLGRPAVLPTEMIRAAVATWMKCQSMLQIGNAKLHVWVQWETGGRLPFGIYCDRMAKPKGQWGGAPEIASMARKEKVDMWVWAPCDVEEGFFVRQHIFKGGPERIDICRVESLHYEYLEIIEGELDTQLRSNSGATISMQPL